MTYENIIGGNAMEFVKRHRPELNGVKRLALTEMLREFAIQQVKLFNAPAVSKSEGLQGRELLLAYNDFLNKQEGDSDQPTTFNVDLFLSQQ